MARRSKKMTRRESEELFYKLSVVISETDKVDDAAKLLRDLLSVTEVEMIAKRIKIAEMLLDGSTYKNINELLKTSSSTILKVQEWLNTSGSGYRKVIEKTKGRNLRNDTPLSTYDSSAWADMKRQLPAYFWPQILLENIITNSSKKQQARIGTVLKQMKKMEQKNPLYERIDKIMAGHYRNQNQKNKINKVNTASNRRIKEKK
jgi:TrpR-related protein YerC/YecD